MKSASPITESPAATPAAELTAEIRAFAAQAEQRIDLSKKDLGTIAHVQQLAASLADTVFSASRVESEIEAARDRLLSDVAEWTELNTATQELQIGSTPISAPGIESLSVRRAVCQLCATIISDVEALTDSLKEVETRAGNTLKLQENEVQKLLSNPSIAPLVEMLYELTTEAEKLQVARSRYFAEDEPRSPRPAAPPVGDDHSITGIEAVIRSRIKFLSLAVTTDPINFTAVLKRSRSAVAA